MALNGERPWTRTCAHELSLKTLHLIFSVEAKAQLIVPPWCRVNLGLYTCTYVLMKMTLFIPLYSIFVLSLFLNLAVSSLGVCLHYKYWLCLIAAGTRPVVESKMIPTLQGS
jgi:hypothetical protein